MTKQFLQELLRSSKLDPAGWCNTAATRSVKIGRRELHEQDIKGGGVRKLQIKQSLAPHGIVYKILHSRHFLDESKNWPSV